MTDQNECSLGDRHCVPCEGGIAPLTLEQAAVMLSQLDPGWRLGDDARSIARDFSFRDFREAMAFAAAIGWMADQEGHHPDLELGWGRCGVQYTTHAIGGLSENDFVCAAKVDRVADPLRA